MDTITQFIEQLVTTWVGGLEDSGYWGIFLLMTIESSFIPFPSEIVMIPAGAMAASGTLNIWGVICAGTLGSMVGALINYWLALFMGRAFLLRYGKYFFLPHDKILLAEKEWNRYGEVTTFVCRLLPVIRQIISVPAGLARMNLFRFCLWTSAGAGIWVVILTYIGYYFGDDAVAWWNSYKRGITIGLMTFCGLVVVGFFVRRRMKSKTPTVEAETP